MANYIIVALSLLLLFGAPLSAQENVIEVSKKQKSLVTKRTATWCPNCGAPEVWPMIKNLQEDLGDQAVVVAAHHSASSALHSPIAKELIDNFETSFGQPVFYFNRERIGSGGGATESTLINRVETASQQSPLAQTGLQLTFDEEQRRLQVKGRTVFYESANADFRLAYYLIQKSVIASQSSQGSQVEHLNVIWDAITDETFGVPIDQSSTVEGGQFEHTKEYDLPDDLAIDNIRVAAIIWRKNEEGIYEFINAEYTDDFQTGLVSQVYSLSNLHSFTLQPTISDGNSLAKIHLSSQLPNCSLRIYNGQGQIVQTLFTGHLSKGEHLFPLEVAQPGQYLVSFRSGKQVSTLRLFKLP